MNDAIARYQELLRQYPDHELARFSLGKAYYDQGDYPQARDQFERALSRKPDWMAVAILLGKCELALNNRAGAKVHFERARELAIAQNHEGPLADMDQALRELE